MSHANWLRNRFPSERIAGDIPELLWDFKNRIDFKSLHVFGQTGYAFIYRGKTARNKKLSARSIHGHFIGVEREETLFRIFVPTYKKVLITRRNDFKLCQDSVLPGVSTLLDGISRQGQIDTESNTESNAEEILVQAFQIYSLPLSRIFVSKRKNVDPRLPRTFEEAVTNELWCEAIESEYNALIRRNTWTYMLRTSDNKPLPTTWVFRLKPIDDSGHKVLHNRRNTWTYVLRTSDNKPLPTTWVFRLKPIDDSGHKVLHNRRNTWTYVLRTSDNKPLPTTWVFRLKPIDDSGHKVLHNRPNTWTYVLRTSENKPLPTTWVFRLKTIDDSGHKVLHKARCCVRDEIQQPHLDYDSEATYAPVASHEAIRLILAVASAENLIVEGGDVSNAYLIGDVDTEVYIEQPTDSSGSEARPNHVCKLNKAMHGLRQAGNLWGSLFVATVTQWRFMMSRIDHCVFYKVDNAKFIILVVVVDDMKFVSNSQDLLEAFKHHLSTEFYVKLFGELKNFLGSEVTQSAAGIRISQARYKKEVLRKYGLLQANGCATPLPTNADLSLATEYEPILSKLEHSEYRCIVGELLYLYVCTQSDLFFSVAALARQVHFPTRRHADLLKRILRYISGTRTYGILYPRGSGQSLLNLEALVDADWGGFRSMRTSTTGFVVTPNCSPFTWKSRRKTMVALSSAEAEYVALSTCAKNLTCLRRIFLEVKRKTPIEENMSEEAALLHVDNTAAMSLATREQISERNKHVDIKVHHVGELISQGIVELRYVPSAHPLADMLNKPVERSILELHSKALSLISFEGL